MSNTEPTMACGYDTQMLCASEITYTNIHTDIIKQLILLDDQYQ